MHLWVPTYSYLAPKSDCALDFTSTQRTQEALDTKKLASEPWVCAGHWHFQEAHCSKNISRSATEIEVCERGCAGLAYGLQKLKKKTHTVAPKIMLRWKNVEEVSVFVLSSHYENPNTQGGLTAVMLFLCCKYAYDLLWGTQFTWPVNACFIASQIDVWSEAYNGWKQRAQIRSKSFKYAARKK